jgi:DNA polymerase-3 subunit epsilon
MRLDQAAYAAIDFESAGTAPGLTDAPVQIAIAHMDGFLPRPEQALRSYLHTDRPITWAAQQVHGIRPADLQHAPPMADLWPAIQERLRGRILIAHSAATERRFLRAFPTHRFGPWIDTLLLARRLHPSLPSHRLGDLIAHFQLQDTLTPLCPGLAWHDALYDATASLILLRHLIQQARWETLSIEMLLP